MRLTTEQLDALEAALKAATEGEITLVPNAGIDDDPDQRYWAIEAGQGYYDGPKTGFRLTGFISAADSRLIALAHNALPTLLAAARLTVPEPIGEKHRDGGPWQVWEPFYERWVYAKWREQSEMWRRLDGGDVIGTPTHALPMPPAPEGTDA